MVDSPISRRNALYTLGAAGLAGLAGCSSSGDESTSSSATSETSSSGTDTVRAAFVYSSEVGDLGWSWAHDQGRKAAAQSFDWLETDYTAAVAASDSQRVFEQYASEGYDIVFGCSFGYMDPMMQVAQDHPDVVFEHCTGYKTRENLGRYFGKMGQAKYLAGIAAGRLTEANTIGMVAPFATAEVIRLTNAMALGARSVNPDATFKVRWINSWYDPTSSGEAASSLIDDGCDVIASGMDSAAPVKTAHEADVWAIGYDAPMGQFGGDDYIVAPIWNWEVFYKPTIQSVKDGSWMSDFYWEGIDSNIVGLSDWGPEVPEDVRSEVSTAHTSIVEGNLDIWAGSKFEGKSDEFLFEEMSSFVEGFDSEVPE